MVIREGKFGRFYGCIDYPKCNQIKPISTNVKCPKCSEGEIVEKYSPKSKKRFYGCSRYPDCDYLSKYEPIDKECGNCGHPYLEVRFRKVDDGYEKYLRCPECKQKYDIKK